jgi:hypothetical protein
MTAPLTNPVTLLAIGLTGLAFGIVWVLACLQGYDGR